MKKSVCSDWIARSELGYPLALNNHIERWRDACNGIGTSRCYLEYIDEVGGELILRTWSVKGYKKGKVEAAEIIRRGEDLIPYFCHCDYWNMSGYVAKYDIPEWHPKEWWRWADKKETSKGWVGGYIINQKEIMDRYDPHHLYSKNLMIHPFKFLVILKQNPAVEMLIKNGYGSLIGCLNMLNKKGRTIPEILKVNPKWVKYLKGKGRNELIACRKPYVKTEDEADWYAAMLADIDYKPNLKYVGKYFQDLRAYKVQHGWLGWTYSDYLKMAADIGYPMNEKKVLFPKDLKEAHDKVMSEYKILQEEKKNEHLKEWVKQLQKYRYENGGLFIRPAETCAELKDESEQMSNCVRSYADRYSKGLTAIFFIRQISKPNKSLVTLELKGNRVAQCLAAHNKQPDETIKRFVDEWKKEFRFV